MNLEKLVGRGRKPELGDVFEAHIGGRNITGLVVGANLRGAKEAPMEGASLIYLYDPSKVKGGVPDGPLQPSDLLVPPIFTNQRPWTHGYFRKVKSIEVAEDQRLEHHCFWRVSTNQYVDERLNVLPAKIDPCGLWGLVSTEWIDDHLSDALGIPRAD